MDSCSINNNIGDMHNNDSNSSNDYIIGSNDNNYNIPIRRLSTTCHASLSKDIRRKTLEEWLHDQHRRSMSVPDLHRLYKEWHLYQNSGLEDIEPFQLQVDLLNIRTDFIMKRPAMRVKMGAIKYVSSRSNTPTGDWNEGFVFVVSFHAQLFNTIEFDLYEVPRKNWPKRIQHVGKAKLKISRLEGRENVFTTFLPIYEYSSSRRRLPADTTELIQRSGMFRKAMNTLFGTAKIIGSVQVRIRYKFQQGDETAAIRANRWKKNMEKKRINDIKMLDDTTTPRQFDNSNESARNDVLHSLDPSSPFPISVPMSSSVSQSASTSTQPRQRQSSQYTLKSSHNSSKRLRLTSKASTSSLNKRHPSLQSSTSSNDLRSSSQTSGLSNTKFKTNDNNPRSQHGRGDLARDEEFVNELFKDQLNKVMASSIPRQHIPTAMPSKKLYNHGTRDSSLDTNARQRRQLWKHHRHNRRIKGQKGKRQRGHCISFNWLTALFHPNRDLHSARGRRYGFQQNDMDGDDQEYDNKNSTNNKMNPSSSSSTKATKVTTNHGAPSSQQLIIPMCKKEKEHGTARRLTNKAKKKAKHIISSVDFGDKNFGSRWMQDSFEEVALSHPMMDFLIGLAVKTQTQALVRAIIILANSFGQGFKVTAFQLVKAMLLLEKFYRSIPKQMTSNEVKDRYIIDVGNHYFRYALVAYGWRGLAYLGLYGQLIRRSGGKSRSNRLAILNYLRIESRDLLGYEYGLRDGAAFQPSYFVAVDREKKTIVLSIRGTWSLYDAITDLVCYYVPWKGGLVHSGMLASAQWFFIHIIPQIFRYIHIHARNLKGLTITGHSLGGGCGSLLTMMVADQMDTLKKLANNPDFQLQCYSYAPVALTSYDLSCKYDQYIQSFIVQDDIVGRLSYGTAIKLKELILDTISSYEAVGGMTKVLTHRKSRKLCFQIIEKCRKLIFQPSNETPPMLYIPGKIIHLQRRRVKRFGGNNGSSSTTESSSTAHKSKHIPGASRTEYSVRWETRRICEEMIVTKTAIVDHSIGSYQTAFSKLSAMYPAAIYPSNFIE